MAAAIENQAESSQSYACLDPECDRTFGTEHGMKSHWGMYHEKEGALIEELQRLADELGHSPTCEDMEELGEFSILTYGDTFGSWNDALEEANLELNKMSYSYSKEKLIGELHRLADELGRTPTSIEMDESGIFSHSPYITFFESWNNALEEAGFEPRYRNATGEEHHRFVHGDSPDYGLGWKSNISPRIRERDNYTCQTCYKHQSKLNRKLSVHHITPRWKFTKETDDPDYEAMNSSSNLVTLCNSCHRKFEGKWEDCGPWEFARRGRALLRQERSSSQAEVVV